MHATFSECLSLGVGGKEGTFPSLTVNTKAHRPSHITMCVCAPRFLPFPHKLLRGLIDWLSHFLAGNEMAWSQHLRDPSRTELV